MNCRPGCKSMRSPVFWKSGEISDDSNFSCVFCEVLSELLTIAHLDADTDEEVVIIWATSVRVERRVTRQKVQRNLDRLFSNRFASLFILSKLMTITDRIKISAARAKLDWTWIRVALREKVKVELAFASRLAYCLFKSMPALNCWYSIGDIKLCHNYSDCDRNKKSAKGNQKYRKNHEPAHQRWGDHPVDPGTPKMPGTSYM